MRRLLPLLLLLLLPLLAAPPPARAYMFDCGGISVPDRERLAAAGDRRGIYCLALTRAAQYEAIDHTWQCAKARPPAVAAVTRARQYGLTDDWVESPFAEGEAFCVTGTWQQERAERAEAGARYRACLSEAHRQCQGQPYCTPPTWRCNE